MEPGCATPLQMSCNSSITSEPSHYSTPMIMDQPDQAFSDQRYSESFSTPHKRGSDSSNSEIFGFSRNSSEKSNPQSKLLRIKHMRPGDRRPREILLPIFYHQRHSYRHKQRASIKNEAKTLDDSLNSSRKTIPKIPNRKRVSFGSDLGDPIELEGFSSLGRSSGQSLIDSIISVTRNKDVASNSPKLSLDSLEMEVIVPEKGKGSVATQATNSVTDPVVFNHKPKNSEEEKAIITTQAGTVSTMGNIENEEIPEFFYEREVFEYEKEAKSSGVFGAVADFNEFPTIAWCQKCNKEVVTVVKPELQAAKGFFKKIDAMLCCCSTFWLKNQVLVHFCLGCNVEIARVVAKF